MNPDLVFHDPYFLDFLGLKESYSENDLETTILAELQQFIIELGSDFAFIARQKRITIETFSTLNKSTPSESHILYETNLIASPCHITLIFPRKR